MGRRLAPAERFWLVVAHLSPSPVGIGPSLDERYLIMKKAHRDEAIETLRSNMKQAFEQLEARGLRLENDIDGWIHLARLVEVPEEKIGSMTLDDIFTQAIVWCDRANYKALLDAQAQNLIRQPNPKKFPHPTATAIFEVLENSPNALTKAEIRTEVDTEKSAPCSRNTIALYLDWLVEEGHVIQDGTRYSPK